MKSHDLCRPRAATWLLPWLLLPAASCFAQPVTTTTAPQLLTLASASTQQHGFRYPGPYLSKLLQQPGNAATVLAQGHAEAIAEQSQSIQIDLNEHLSMVAHHVRWHRHLAR